MNQTPIQTFTRLEFLRQPETNPPQEYIEGKIIPKPMPQGEHSAIQTELAATINQNLRK
ncbi:MAG: Uma2 family endonuclease, partial [Halothece sp.]